MRTKSSKKLSLGEYGRQRTSKKFHDLVLSLRSQNSRVLETKVFLALFSRRKVSVDDRIILTNTFFIEFLRFVNKSSLFMLAQAFLNREGLFCFLGVVLLAESAQNPLKNGSVMHGL